MLLCDVSIGIEESFEFSEPEGGGGRDLVKSFRFGGGRSARRKLETISRTFSVVRSGASVDGGAAGAEARSAGAEAAPPSTRAERRTTENGSEMSEACFWYGGRTPNRKDLTKSLPPEPGGSLNSKDYSIPLIWTDIGG